MFIIFFALNKIIWKCLFIYLFIYLRHDEPDWELPQQQQQAEYKTFYSFVILAYKYLQYSTQKD